MTKPSDQDMILKDSNILCSNCKNCDGKYNYNNNIITDPESGEIICSSCGLVIYNETSVFCGPESKNFGNTQHPERDRRIGMPNSLARHDMGLSTIIGRSN